MTFIRVSS